MGRARPPEMIKVPMPLIVSKDRARVAILPCLVRCRPALSRRTAPGAPAGISRLFGLQRYRARRGARRAPP